MAQDKTPLPPRPGDTAPGNEAPGNKAPGNKAPVGTPGTGEHLCPDCKGSGKQADKPCPTCDGTGKVNVGIGGA